MTFSDRNVSDAKDGFVECPSYEDESYGLIKKELDKGIQVNGVSLYRSEVHPLIHVLIYVQYVQCKTVNSPALFYA